MGLKRAAAAPEPPKTAEKRSHGRDVPDLIRQLSNDDVSVRRWAARDLSICPEAVDDLLSALSVESDHSVREAILESLDRIGGQEVASGLIPMLRSEDAALRNRVIESLQSLPDEVAASMAELLHDEDPDVRIFAIDILRALAHPDTPEWLRSVLAVEENVNVVANAIDCLAEVGTPDMVEDVRAVRSRFPGEPFVSFAVDTAVRRIAGGA